MAEKAWKPVKNMVRKRCSVPQAAVVSGKSGVIARFCNVFGTADWYEPGCAQCYLPRVLSCAMMYGGADSSIADSNALELYDYENAQIKCLVLWGAGPAYSAPASGGRMVNELRAKGVKTICIDPRFTPDAAKADIWLPIRPGTDVALQMAWIRYILENRRYDEEFVTRWTNLPYLVEVESRFLPVRKRVRTVHRIRFMYGMRRQHPCSRWSIRMMRI